MVISVPEPIVTAIITTHNRLHFLKEAIASVLAQRYANLEVVVVNHGSTDGTADYLATLPGRIQTSYLPQSGRPSVAYNHGLAIATGEFVAFLHDDDQWQADKVAQQVEIFCANSEIGFVYSDTCLLFPDGQRKNNALYAHQKHKGFIFNPLLGDCFIHPSAFMACRSALNRVGWFDESLITGEEYDLWLRLAYHFPAGFCPKPLTIIRQHHHQFSRQSQAQLIYNNLITVLERVKQNYSLTAKQRWLLSRHLSRAYTHLGLLYQAEQQQQKARHHFWHSLKLNPIQRRAWISLPQTYR